MEKATAESVRKRSMERLGETRETESNSEKARKKQRMSPQSDAVEYLREKNENEFDVRKKEIELKESALDMKEREQALREKECEGRKNSTEGREERENMFVLLLQQQMIQQQQIIEEIRKQNELMTSLLKK
eukprot:Seg30.4 transcript_id=Seg30.4/GoldUCD/mRNA.D3Y31 product="hypothetical protein" protein_id=Seg30.4/GoldUCD/D3Y31